MRAIAMPFGQHLPVVVSVGVARADDLPPAALGLAQVVGELETLCRLGDHLRVGHLILGDHVVEEHEPEVTPRGHGVDEPVGLDGRFLGVALPLDRDAGALRP